MVERRACATQSAQALYWLLVRSARRCGICAVHEVRQSASSVASWRIPRSEPSVGIRRAIKNDASFDARMYQVASTGERTGASQHRTGARNATASEPAR